MLGVLGVDEAGVLLVELDDFDSEELELDVEDPESELVDPARESVR